MTVHNVVAERSRLVTEARAHFKHMAPREVREAVLLLWPDAVSTEEQNECSIDDAGVFVTGPGFALLLDGTDHASEPRQLRDLIEELRMRRTIPAAFDEERGALLAADGHTWRVVISRAQDFDGYEARAIPPKDAIAQPILYAFTANIPHPSNGQTFPAVVAETLISKLLCNARKWADGAIESAKRIEKARAR